MVKRTIVWTKTAKKQRRGILKFWTKHNKSSEYSIKLLSLISDKVKSIAINPLIYKASIFPNTRVAVMGHFSIYYQVIREKIIVTAFWDNRQNPKKLIKALNKE